MLSGWTYKRMTANTEEEKWADEWRFLWRMAWGVWWLTLLCAVAAIACVALIPW